MQIALTLAKNAAKNNEVPVGAVIVLDNKIIGSGKNQTIANSDPCAHAEIIAIREAGKVIGNYRLNKCELFVTLEPCLMCLGAIINSRISKVTYALTDPKFGACGGFINLIDTKKVLCHHTTFTKGIGEIESKKILQNFFQAKRKNIN